MCVYVRAHPDFSTNGDSRGGIWRKGGGGKWPKTVPDFYFENSINSNETIKQRMSKAFDMRCHWIQDRVRQKQHNAHWRPGYENDGDYFTKRHSPSHHQCMRARHLHTAACIIEATNQAVQQQLNDWNNQFCEGVLVPQGAPSDPLQVQLSTRTGSLPIGQAPVTGY